LTEGAEVFQPVVSLEGHAASDAAPVIQRVQQGGVKRAVMTSSLAGAYDRLQLATARATATIAKRLSKGRVTAVSTAWLHSRRCWRCRNGSERTLGALQASLAGSYG